MMEKAFNVASAEIESALIGRILIVDDDPVVAGMLGVSLSSAGHEVVEAYSGEEALALLAKLQGKALPDIVFLDIEMGSGIDGYETCRRLCATEATRDIPIIFLSGHDQLDDRLHAYDAGGSDFMAKPFLPDEVLRKARLSIRHKRRQEVAVVENQTTFNTAMTALTSLGDSQVTLKFSRGALGCRTLRALAELMIESMAGFGLNCQVQLRTPSEVLTLTPQGLASPLEESVIEMSKTMDRIFSFGNRLIVNYDSVSLLVTNMPIADENLCGRIRDQAATIAEAGELAVGNICLRTEAATRVSELHELAEISRKAVEELRGGYQELQISTRAELENMADSIEGLYVHLGLTDNQEFTISNCVRGAVDGVLTLIERSSELDSTFAGVVESLTKASERTVSQESEAPPAVELW